MNLIHLNKVINKIVPTWLGIANQKTKAFNVTTSKSKTIGSSMIELLLAAVVGLFAASAAAQIINNLNNSGLNRRAAAGSAIDVAINNDLAWFQQYASLWRLQTGPYTSLPILVTKTPVDYSNGPITYAPYEPSECVGSDMAISFRRDAADSSTYISPINSPPNPIAASDSFQPIALPNVASDYTLTRRIQTGRVKFSVDINYVLRKSGVIQLSKDSSLFLPASGWCS